jgi:hypothetical protein
MPIFKREITLKILSQGEEEMRFFCSAMAIFNSGLRKEWLLATSFGKFART